MENSIQGSDHFATRGKTIIRIHRCGPGDDGSLALGGEQPQVQLALRLDPDQLLEILLRLLGGIIYIASDNGRPNRQRWP